MTKHDEIQAQPTPFSWSTGIVPTVEGPKICLLKVDTVLGSIHLYMPAEVMDNLAATLKTTTAKVRASSLTVANMADMATVTSLRERKPL